MPENSLERVKTLSEGLSPEDRLELWRYIAEFPDSGINKVVPSAPPLFPLDISTPREEQADPDVQSFRRECRIENGDAVIYFDDAEVMRVIFHPTRYANIFFEKLKAKTDFLKVSGEQRQRFIDRVREAVYADTGKRLSDDEILAVEPEALRRLGLALLKESVE